MGQRKQQKKRKKKLELENIIQVKNQLVTYFMILYKKQNLVNW